MSARVTAPGPTASLDPPVQLPGTLPAKVPVLHRPLASYYLLLSTTGALLVIGVVMVFSASSVRDYADTGASWSTGLKQGLFVLVGVPVMLGASRLPVRA